MLDSNRGNRSPPSKPSANEKPQKSLVNNKKTVGWVSKTWTPVDLKLPGWVTSAWPKPSEKLFNDFLFFFPVWHLTFCMWRLKAETMTKILSVFCHECHQQSNEEKIGYFNLVTRALDDCELKTCKQHSRALLLLALWNVAYLTEEYTFSLHSLALWENHDLGLGKGANHAVDHLFFHLERGHSWTLML